MKLIIDCILFGVCRRERNYDWPWFCQV